MPPSGRRSPLLSFSSAELRPLESSIVFDPKPLAEHPNAVKKPWYHYLPLCGTLILLLAPHPSLFYFLFDFWYRTRHQPITLAIHLFIAYALTFSVFSSLIVCLARDPGPPNAVSRLEGASGEGEEMDLSQALMGGGDDDFSSPGKWCRKCWAPKPERTHHCSLCGRCVLKMDHHCPWIGNRCIGHRTYPAFVHFLCSVTLLSLYVAVSSIHALIYSFHHYYEVNEMTPVHELALAFTGCIFTLIIGSFACYHLYLITTNQTTLENITPFILLRHLPPLPRTGHSLSDPPLEPELSYTQRRLVKDAHGSVCLYDVGWRNNWAQVFGSRSGPAKIIRLFCGWNPSGDGKTFPRNPRSEEMLSRLAEELVKADRNNA